MAQSGVIATPTSGWLSYSKGRARDRASQLFSRISETISRNRNELESFRDEPNSSLGTLLDAQDRRNISTPVEEMEDLLERLEKLKDSKWNSLQNRASTKSAFSSQMGV